MTKVRSSDIRPPFPGRVRSRGPGVLDPHTGTQQVRGHLLEHRSGKDTLRTGGRFEHQPDSDAVGLLRNELEIGAVGPKEVAGWAEVNHGASFWLVGCGRGGLRRRPR